MGAAVNWVLTNGKHSPAKVQRRKWSIPPLPPVSNVFARSGFVSACGLALLLGVRAPAATRELGRPLFREFSPGAAKIGYMNQAVAQDREGFIYLASYTMLRFCDGTDWRPITMPEESAGPRKFALAPDGTLYVGGAGVIGYLRGAGAAAKFVSLADRLPPSELGADEIHDVLAVGAAVYFADEEKILRWQDGAFVAMPCRAPARSRATRLHEVRGVAYVTSPGRPLCRLAGDRLEPVADDPVLRDNTIVMMETARSDALQLLTERNGFFQLEGGRVSRLPSPTNNWLAGRHVWRAARTAEGGLAVIFDGPSGGGGMRFDAAGDYVGPIDETLGLWLHTFRDVFCDREGGLWLGSTEGAFRLEWPSAVSVFDAINGLGGSAVTAVARRDGVLYATSAEGVYRLRPMNEQGQIARFERVADGAGGGSEARGRGAGAAVECAAAESGGRWVASTEGIELRGKNGDVLRRLPALVSGSAGTVACLLEENAPEGRVLWVGGTGGLLRVEVARAFPSRAPLGVVLTSAGVHEGERLEPEHGPLRFNFVAPRHQIANGVTYQTRLSGFDHGWSTWSDVRLRSFTRLPSGAYRFEVRARDADGVISAPAAIAFVVRAPWWLTWWAVAGYVAAGAGLIGVWVRRNTRALRQRAEKLEAVVSERTVELAEKNRELMRLNRLESEEKIAARLAEEKARLEVLRYQLNPHFLFNTLASISGSLPAGASTARMMVERLAHFCRLTLHRGNDHEWTTLGEEMTLLRAYLEIEQSRWGDLLDVEMIGIEELAQERLPHFLLLPLVENALKYGCATSADRVGVRLEARREADGVLTLVVANTGTWVTPEDRAAVPSLGIGLENVRERLRRYYPQEHEFVVRAAEGWVTVTLRIWAAPV